eukprot:1703230-Prymnesium_polylepis.1
MEGEKMGERPRWYSGKVTGPHPTATRRPLTITQNVQPATTRAHHPCPLRRSPKKSCGCSTPSSATCRSSPRR